MAETSADIQLDLMFALAYEENIRVVKVSTKLRHRIPMAGTPEAEAILGRATPGGPTDVQHLQPIHDAEKGSSAGNSVTRGFNDAGSDEQTAEGDGIKGATEHNEIASDPMARPRK